MMEEKNPKEREIDRLKQFPELIDDPHPEIHGVLLQDQIRYFVDNFKMIDPFKEKSLKPAGYELTIGDSYAYGGQVRSLEWEDVITLEPFQVAILTTAETLNLPHFLIARWNIRVRWAYEGLLWVGGPQVDPGWIGRLSCPIYNLSHKSVVLERGEGIALMDFVKTTPVNPDTEEYTRYRRPPKRVGLRDYGVEDFESALYTTAAKTVKLVKDDVEKFKTTLSKQETKLDSFAGLSFAALAFVLAALSIFYTEEPGSTIPYPILLTILAALSTFSFIVVVWGFFAGDKRAMRKPVLVTVSIVAIALVGCSALFMKTWSNDMLVRLENLEAAAAAQEQSQQEPQEQQTQESQPNVDEETADPN